MQRYRNYWAVVNANLSRLNGQPFTQAGHAKASPFIQTLKPSKAMPTILSHVAVPLALGLGLGSRVISRPLLLLGMLASVLPDFDVIAFRLNVAYSHAFGHRGATHSLAFALVLATLALAFARQLHSSRLAVFMFVAVATVSHGLLDMFTNGGLGVGLWWPWSDERFFAPWQVIEVSPLSLRRVFSERGLVVFQSELLWVWVPAALVAGALVAWRKLSANPSQTSGG